MIEQYCVTVQNAVKTLFSTPKMDTPFNRSSLTSRSPPPTRPEPEPARTPTTSTPTAPPCTEVVSTPEIQKWLCRIEQYLNDICTVSCEGKLNTDQKLKISNTCRSIIGGVSQLAVQYQSVKQKLIAAHTQIETLASEKEIGDQIKDLKSSMLSSKITSPIESFANIVRKGQKSIVCPPSTASIAIYPDNKERPSVETKKIVQDIIKPDKLKLHIRGVWNTKNGGVIISSERKDDLDKLKNSELLKTSGLKIEDTTRRRPRIILLGVPSDIPEKDVFDCLYEQNIADKQANFERAKFLNSFRLSHKSGKKDSSHCNYIIEVTAELRKILIQQNRVYINWTSCPVRDYTLVTRCYKCQQYGHSAKFCRDSNPTCGHCGCVGHSIKECSVRDKPPKCASCSRFKKPSDHKTGDEQCPAKKSAEARYLRSTDYEGA